MQSSRSVVMTATVRLIHVHTSPTSQRGTLATWVRQYPSLRGLPAIARPTLASAAGWYFFIRMTIADHSSPHWPARGTTVSPSSVSPSCGHTQGNLLPALHPRRDQLPVRHCTTDRHHSGCVVQQVAHTSVVARTMATTGPTTILSPGTAP